MKFGLSQVDLPCEPLVWDDVTRDILNIYRQSCRLKAGIFAVCTEGKMTTAINLIDYEVRPNGPITLLPGTIIQFHERTEKVRLCFAEFSSGCVGRISLIKPMISFFSKIIERPIVELQGDITSYLKDYSFLLVRTTCDERFFPPLEVTEVSLKSILTAAGLIYQKYSWKDYNMNHEEEICCELVGLVTEHYVGEHRAQSYTDKSGILLQRLGTTVKQVIGHNVLGVIAYVVVIDARAKLKSTHMTIQKIAYSLNFPSASSFGKYLGRYVDMDPLEFRNS